MKTPRQSIKLEEEQRQLLEEWVRAHRTPQQVVKRCQIILRSAEGKSDEAIAKELDINRHTCRLWRERFASCGADCLWEVEAGRGGGNLSRMHKTQETAKESRLNFMYSHLRNRTLDCMAKKQKTEAKKANAAFLKPVQPDDSLAAIVGSTPLPRTELTKKLWEYIREHKLQDPKEKRNINADDKLKAIFNGKQKVSMFEMTKLVNEHLL